MGWLIVLCFGTFLLGLIKLTDWGMLFAYREENEMAKYDKKWQKGSSDEKFEALFFGIFGSAFWMAVNKLKFAVLALLVLLMIAEAVILVSGVIFGLISLLVALIFGVFWVAIWFYSWLRCYELRKDPDNENFPYNFPIRLGFTVISWVALFLGVWLILM